MQNNQTKIERSIRIVVGLILVVLFFTGTFTTGLGITALVIGAIMLLTGLTGFCPLYTVLGINHHKSP